MRKTVALRNLPRNRVFFIDAGPRRFKVLKQLAGVATEVQPLATRTVRIKNRCFEVLAEKPQILAPDALVEIEVKEKAHV